jgi:hypothetical protein
MNYFSKLRRRAGRYFKFSANVGGASDLTALPGCRFRIARKYIGYMDTSGCQNAAHVHVGRFGPDGLPVNFTIPCTNGSVPTTKVWEDTFVDDDDPDTP